LTCTITELEHDDNSIIEKNRYIKSMRSLSRYYYKPVKRHIQWLDPSIKDRIREVNIRIQESVGNTEKPWNEG
jgi:hypothetical protein